MISCSFFEKVFLFPITDVLSVFFLSFWRSELGAISLDSLFLRFKALSFVEFDLIRLLSLSKSQVISRSEETSLFSTDLSDFFDFFLDFLFGEGSSFSDSEDEDVDAEEEDGEDDDDEICFDFSVLTLFFKDLILL